MRIGIISERRIKTRNPFKRYSRETIVSAKNPFELIIAGIPYSAEKLSGISPKRIKKAVLKAEEILRNSGADKIITTASLKEYTSITFDSKKQIFSAVIPGCIRNIAPKCGIYPPDCRICIRADKMDRITEYLATELCYDTKKVLLYIADKSDVADFQERFFDETGALAEIVCDDSPKADILVDLTVPSVRIGRDILIDGIELDLDMGGCDVNFLDIATYIGEEYTLKKISSYFMGKKKLTLQAT